MMQEIKAAGLAFSVLSLAGFMSLTNQSSGQFTVPAPSAYTGECTSTADFAAMPESSWCEVPGSFLDALKPAVQPYDKNFRNVMLAWSSGVYDLTNDQLLAHGGGHNDSAITGVYSFKLSDFQWHVELAPFEAVDIPNPDPAENVPYCGPNLDSWCSVHTYYGLVYDPVREAMWRLGGSMWNLGTGGFQGLKYDIGTSTPSLEYEGYVTGAYSFGLVSAVYLPDWDSIFYYGETAGPPRLWDLSTNTITEYSGINSSDRPYYRSLTWDSGNEILVQMGDGQLNHITFNVDASVATRVAVTDSTGCAQVIAQPSNGAAYRPSTGTIYYWLPDFNETSVWEYDPATRTCTEITAHGSNAAVPKMDIQVTSPTTDTRGPFGRWRYTGPEEDMFILAPCTTCEVLFWKPPAP